MPRFLLSVLLLMATVLGSHQAISGQVIGMADIEIMPPNPSTQSMISARLSGMWDNACTPESPNVSMMGNLIQVRTCNPGEVCAEVITPWELTVDLGQLAAGTYDMVVTYDTGCDPARRRQIGGTTFTVSAGAGGTITGVVPLQVLCWNRSTGQAITIIPQASSWDCEAEGLQVNVGDQVFIGIESIRSE